MQVKEAEEELSIQLPTEYIAFSRPHHFQAFKVFFKIDDWAFWDLTTAVKINLSLRAEQIIQTDDFAFAENADQQILLYRKVDPQATKIMLLTNRYDWMFYAYSLSEFTHFKTTEILIEEIETVGFQQQDLSAIKNCPGSLFEYAFRLNTSKFSDNYSEERNQKAREILFQIAEREHPEVAHALANYYYYYDFDEVDVDKVIEWREKAIAWGSLEDVYELADFLIDHQPEQLDRAIQLLVVFPRKSGRLKKSIFINPKPKYNVYQEENVY